MRGYILIHDDKHLERVTKEYTAYFNQERPHADPRSIGSDKIKANERAGYIEDNPWGGYITAIRVRRT